MIRDKVYREGFISFRKNYGALVNPYPSGSNEFNSFERGWLQAQRLASNELVNHFERHRSSIEAGKKKITSEDLEKRKKAYRCRKG